MSASDIGGPSPLKFWGRKTQFSTTPFCDFIANISRLEQDVVDWKRRWKLQSLPYMHTKFGELWSTNGKNGTLICTNFLQTAVLVLPVLTVVNVCVIYVIFTCAVYDRPTSLSTSLYSLCCTFSYFGPPYRRDCCNCFTIRHYSYELMNLWSCKLVNLSNQKSSSY